MNRPRARVGSSDPTEVDLRYANSATFQLSRWCSLTLLGDEELDTRWPVDRMSGLGCLRAVSRAETRAVVGSSSARWAGVKIGLVEDEGVLSVRESAAKAVEGLLGTFAGATSANVLGVSAADIVL